MGVDTKGFIYGKNKDRFSKEALVGYFHQKYTGVKVIQEEWQEKCSFMEILFTDGEDNRLLRVYYDYTSYRNEGYPKLEDYYIILFNLGMWGNSVETIKGIVSLFGGGYVLENDCYDDWYLIDGADNNIPEITLLSTVMTKYGVDEKTATEWIDIYQKVCSLDDESEVK